MLHNDYVPNCWQPVSLARRSRTRRRGGLSGRAPSSWANETYQDLEGTRGPAGRAGLGNPGPRQSAAQGRRRKRPYAHDAGGFRKNLIHDLDEDGFADMFAQTIAYGMLAARISRPVGIIADNLADMVPKTNPFLKELFGNFLKIGGRDKRQGLDFDELGVRDVVDVLNDANMEAVLRDFGDRNPKEDPVIHFYELFLKEYDPKKRMQRGVFYTPAPGGELHRSRRR